MALSGGDRRKVGSWLSSGQGDVSRGYQDLGGQMRGQTERAGSLWNQNQDWGLGELKNIYGEIGSGGGGGGVPGYGGELDASKAWWQKVADTGWRTPEQKEGGWGWGNFKNFAQTGGWSPEEMADFRARSASGLPELYGGLRNEMVRGRTVQGGYGPGYSTGLSQLARDRARSLAEAGLGAETSLAESIRKGKMWGSEQGAGAARGELGQMQTAQGRLDSIAQQIAAANRAAAASRAGAADRDTAMRLGLIDRITGLSRETGGDLPYGAAWGGALGGRVGADTGYAGAYNATQQKGPSIWDRLLTAGTSAATSAAGLGWQPFGK